MWTYPKDHICKACHQDMADAENEDDNVTCLVTVVTVEGHKYRRTKYHFLEEGGRCLDCQIKHGGIHHALCDVERCPVCDDQLISCNCRGKGFSVLGTRRRRKNK